jgi:hypothetical protein
VPIIFTLLLLATASDFADLVILKANNGNQNIIYPLELTYKNIVWL